MASGGYPGSYEKGCEIVMDEMEENTEVFFAGVALQDETLKTSGGRVLGVTAVAPTLAEAIEAAYRNVEKVSFEKAYYRKDIGKRALDAERK